MKYVITSEFDLTPEQIANMQKSFKDIESGNKIVYLPPGFFITDIESGITAGISKKDCE